MGQLQSSPIGFSDLNEGENFVISVFREWLCEGQPACKTVSLIEARLQSHPLRHSLSYLFDFFFRLTEEKPQPPHIQESGMLTKGEERLLEWLSTASETENETIESSFLRDYCKCRSPQQISRSGRDYLMQMIDLKSAQVYSSKL